jgi:hypothetical protein
MQALSLNLCIFKKVSNLGSKDASTVCMHSEIVYDFMVHCAWESMFVQIRITYLRTASPAAPGFALHPGCCGFTKQAARSMQGKLMKQTGGNT